MQTLTNNVSNVRDIPFQNGIDLNNLSGVSAFQEGFATSSTNDGLSRRFSERRAAKRARIDKRLPSMTEETDYVEMPPIPPSLLSLFSDDLMEGPASVAGSSVHTPAISYQNVCSKKETS